MNKKWILIGIVIFCALIIYFGKNETNLASINKNEVSSIQIIGTMGNPMYGADSKIIVNREEIKNFVNTFNSGEIGKKVKDTDVMIGFLNKYIFFDGDKVIAEYKFNTNNTNILGIEDEFYYVKYDKNLELPNELYTKSKSPKIVVDINGTPMDLVRYNNKTYVKSDLPELTVEWMEWFNSLSIEEQAAITYVPNLGDVKPLGQN
ncbi:hypothetical protein AN639_02700 [Candidatus Epulonipiscium fishelsonii]|uniref:Uncharacterized protein n=1 Tax=Candidatus Epulonipiscium fishelsonii TaxID=77094 RepID=A0ACC8XFV4_9FIRM|nr:hypothetical protein AN639_02700 [Epulopiscium sp. SCG-B05WGA-EpuloA1]ONI42359.1 hypothetical protein AN396_01865 [Epulopiscium sp. SCG-B11WGA-EpuloA1]